MRRRALIAVALIFLCTCRRPHSPTAGAPPEDLALTSADGVQLAATLYRAKETNPPGLVLVHMLGADRRVWNSFAESAQRAGFMCIAFDLRGHGESIFKNDARISYRSFTPHDWQDVSHDIDAAKRALTVQGADPNNLALVGASIGANLSLDYAASHKDVQALVLVSPGLDYKGIKAQPALKTYGKRPLLLIFSEGDAYAASSGWALKGAAVGLCELREYAGTAHGTDLFDVSRNAAEEVCLWLNQCLGQ